MEEKSSEGKEKRCEGRPRVSWVEVNYSLFPHNGLDKDWYCNRAFILVSSGQYVYGCCVLSGLVCLKVVSCMNHVRKWQHRTLQMATKRSLVKRKHQEIYHINEMRWEERRKLRTSRREMKSSEFNLGRYSVKKSMTLSWTEVDSSLGSHGRVAEWGEWGGGLQNLGFSNEFVNCSCLMTTIFRTVVYGTLTSRLLSLTVGCSLKQNSELLWKAVQQ